MNRCLAWARALSGGDRLHLAAEKAMRSDGRHEGVTEFAWVGARVGERDQAFRRNRAVVVLLGQNLLAARIRQQPGARSERACRFAMPLDD